MCVDDSECGGDEAPKCCGVMAMLSDNLQIMDAPMNGTMGEKFNSKFCMPRTYDTATIEVAGKGKLGAFCMNEDPVSVGL